MEIDIKFHQYIPRIENLNEQERCDFYRWLAHSLTVAIRVTICDKTLPQSEILNRVKWLNEIEHRAITKTYVRPFDIEDTLDFFDMISDYIDKNNNISSQLHHCFTKSLNQLNK